MWLRAMSTLSRFIAVLWGYLRWFWLIPDRIRHPLVVGTYQSSDGQRRSPILARRVEVPMFEILSNPTVRLSEVRSRRFNIIDRSSVASIQEAEDAEIFRILEDVGRKAAETPVEPPLPEVYRPTIWERILGDDLD